MGPSRPARRYLGAQLYQPAPAPAAGSAVATLGDRIVAVGTADECAAALPPGFEDVDLRGTTLVPGFVDAHVHPVVMCVFEQQLLLDNCGSVADVLDLVADRAAGTEPDGVIVGFQLDDQLLRERRLPRAHELDAAADGRPVVLLRRDGHHAVGSTAALTAAGITAAAPDPPGGRVDRDATGEPTGLVAETAVAPLMDLMPAVSMDMLVDGARSWAGRLLGQGVTAISAICQTTAEGPSGAAGALEAVGWAALAEMMPFDIQTILIAPDLADLHAFRSTSLHDPSARRRVDAVKLFLDGTLGGRTACMHRPYADATTPGLRTLDLDVAYRRMVGAHLDGLQICIHAIGDRANQDTADLYERLLSDHPGPHRHRVEHASVLDDRTVDRYAALGISTVVQPINLRSERHWLAGRVGADRLSRTYPFRRLLDAGVTVAGSSDAPIEDTDPLAAMAAAVDRRGLADDQEISPIEALTMYTAGGAAVRCTEDELGRIAPGARADLVVLSGTGFTDPTTRPDARSVLATVIGGAVRYSADGDMPLSSGPWELNP